MLSPVPSVIRAWAAVWALVAVAPAAADDSAGIAAANNDNASAATPVSVEFGGEVARSETVLHRFRHGESPYEFRLVPFAGGWTIWIGEPMRRDRNYIAVVTGPFRGVNPAVINGWHFRNSDNTGPNEPGEKNVNAPGLERNFAFVLDGAGYAAAFAARESALAGNTQAEIDAAMQSLSEVPKGEGQLLIRALELGNLVPNQRAVIERMAFTVRLKFPE